MSPKGEVATKRATEPNELYDSLSQESKDIWDEIGALGFTPEKGFGGMWFARKSGDKAANAIGPAEHIGVLRSMLKEAIGDDETLSDNVITDDDLEEFVEEEIDVENPEMMELDDDGLGNPYLPNAKPNVIKILASSILEYDRIKRERVDLSNQESAAKKKMVFWLNKFRKYLEHDPEKKTLTYSAGRVRGVIKTTETETFLTDHEGPVDE